MHNVSVLGTCSCCGGRVTVPTVYMSVIPPTPTCESCGATTANHGPVIQMQPAQSNPSRPRGWIREHLSTYTT